MSVSETDVPVADGASTRKPRTSVVTYLPDNTVRRGYASLLGDVLSELSRNRWLTWVLFKRDMLAFYKQSLLGVVWVVLIPLVTVGTFILLKGSGVVAVGELSAPYPVYAVSGLAVWQFFSQGLVAGANSLVQGGEMITRINFSKKALVIASLGRTVVSFLVVLILLMIVYFVYRSDGRMPAPTAYALLAPVALVPTILLTLALSFWLALLNGVVRDIGTMLGMMVTFLMLLTPVLYDRPQLAADAGTLAKLMDTITEYNPLYYLVNAPRDLLLQGYITEANGFWIASAVSFGLFFIALVGFHLTETRIAERI